MGDVIVTNEYPDGAEPDNDATMLVRVLATMFRALGQDPKFIAASDAWNYYVKTWKAGILATGQAMPADWEKLVTGEDSPLRVKFLFAWEYHARANTLIDTIIGLPKGIGLLQ